MTEQRKSSPLPSTLPDWISDHLARYQATDGADGYLWDASLGGGEGMIPTLLLTTIGIIAACSPNTGNTPNAANAGNAPSQALAQVAPWVLLRVAQSVCSLA